MSRSNKCCLEFLKMYSEYSQICNERDNVASDKIKEIRLAQYTNLRLRFSNMISHILGVNYYNDAYDVYESDRRCCESVINKFDALERKLNFWRRVGRCGIGLSFIFLLVFALSVYI